LQTKTQKPTDKYFRKARETPREFVALMMLLRFLLVNKKLDLIKNPHALYRDNGPLMDHPEICGKKEFNNAGTRTKDAIDQQTQLHNTCNVTDLSPTGPSSQNITTGVKGNELLFSYPVVV